MRKSLPFAAGCGVVAVLLCASAAGLAVEEAPRVPALPEALPEGTVVLAELKPWAQWGDDFSKTSLARISAEPEVRAFLAGPFAQLATVLKRMAPAQLEELKAPKLAESPLAPVLEVLSAFTPGPFAVAARYSAEDAAAKRAPAAAIIIGMASDKTIETYTEAIPRILDGLLTTFKIECLSFTDHQGTKLLTISTPGAAPRRSLATLCATKGRLLISSELLFCQQIIDGLNGRLAKKLSGSDAYKNTGLLGDEHMVAYLDVAGLQAALGATDKGADLRDRVNDFFAAAGLNRSVAVAWSLKMNGAAFESRTAIFTRGEREGLLGALDEQPLEPEALKLCPKGAPLAAGFRVRSDRIMSFLRSAVKAVQGDKGLAEFNATAQQWNQELGRDLEKEVREVFGNQFVIACLAGLEDSAPFGDLSAMVASLSVKDKKKAAELLEQVLVRVAGRVDAQGRPLVTLKDVEHEGTKIRYLLGLRVLGFIEISPAFAIVEDRMVVGLNVPAVKRAMAVLKEPVSLKDSEVFQNALAGTGGKLGPMFSYLDWAFVYKRSTNFLTAALKLLAPSDVLRQIGLDMNLVPTSEVVAKHLFPGLTVARVTPNGIVVTSRSPLPSMEVVTPPLAAVSAVFAAFRPFAAAEQPKP